MGAFLIMVRNVLIFSALAIPGYILVKLNMLKQEQSAPLSKILMYVGMPFLVISGTVNNLSISKEFLLRILVIAAIGLAATFAMFFASRPLSAFEKEKKTRGVVRFCMVFSNNGFLGIPLAIAVFGKNTHTFTVLIILNIITNVMMYALGSNLVSGNGKSAGIKKAILNPVLIAFVVGIVLNLLNVKSYVPEIVTYSDYFSGIVTPISMTILGMKLASIKFSSLFTSARTYYVSALKLIIFPTIIVLIMFAFKAFMSGLIDNDVILGFFIAFSMPTAGLASTFADTFQGDTESAVTLTLGTTILSILTIPALFGLLNFFI